jgi:type 1 fimbria pilin
MVISGMKKIKALCILSALMVGLMVAISVVSAQTNPQRTIPPIVNIEPSGNVLIRGTVTNIGSDSLEVKSWGGKWTI